MLAVSEPITVAEATVTLTASPATIAPRGTLTVTWEGIGVPSATDWLALVPAGAADSSYVAWGYTTGASAGSTSLTIPPSVILGTYELRLFAQNSWQRLAVSEPITVAVTATLTASPAEVAPGGSVLGEVAWPACVDRQRLAGLGTGQRPRCELCGVGVCDGPAE